MTVGKLFELYKAEQEGKQIMQVMCVTKYGHMSKLIRPVKLSECDLAFLSYTNGDGIYYDYFVEGEEPACIC